MHEGTITAMVGFLIRRKPFQLLAKTTHTLIASRNFHLIGHHDRVISYYELKAAHHL